MSYVFKIVDVIVFDVHTTTVQPLLNAALVKTPYQFLVDSAEYSKRHALTAPFKAGSLTLEPISTKQRSTNYFWQRCTSIVHGAAPDMWKLQIPFVSAVPLAGLAFTPAAKNTKATVAGTAYLSALGWSTKLHVRLFGAMTPADLLSVVQDLRAGSSFAIAGATKKRLSDVFITAAAAIKQELYGNAKAVYHRLTTERHMVISIAKFDGEEKEFHAGDMDDSERAEIHSILLAKSIDVAQLGENEAKPAFLQTQYTPYDFALTYFERGTFLWMQLPRFKGKRTSLWCLPSNLASCSLFLLGLNGFWKTTELHGGAAGPIKDLRDAIRLTVNQLPDAYSNKFCRGFVSNHNDLSKIL